MPNRADQGRAAPGVRVGGRYVLREILGCGATGTVWRADGPDGQVAVKCLHPDLAGDASVVDRFVAEHEMLTGLAHPNLVGIRDLVMDDGVLALVLELVEGPSTRERLEAGPVAPAEAAAIAAGVCRALTAAHAAGVVHRDVKPENVLLGRNGVPRLTDFGVAYVVGQRRSTALGLPVGTAEYVAPELVSGANPTPAADVYGVGVLLYELLTGQPPFRAADPLAVLYRHVHVPPPFPMAAPPALADLVLRCLAKNPAARPSAAEVAGILADDAGAGAPTSPVLGGERPTHPGGGHHAEVTLLAAAEAPGPQVARGRWHPGRSARLRPERGRLGPAGAVVLAGVLGTGMGVAVAGPLPSPGMGRAAVGAPGEVYAAPTGWICTDWQAVPRRPRAMFRACVLGTTGTVAGRAQTRVSSAVVGVPLAAPVDVELRWRRWAGVGWQPVGTGSCPDRFAHVGAQTCAAPAGEGGPATVALVAVPLDAQGLALGSGAATPAITGPLSP